MYVRSMYLMLCSKEEDQILMTRNVNDQSKDGEFQIFKVQEEIHYPILSPSLFLTQQIPKYYNILEFFKCPYPTDFPMKFIQRDRNFTLLNGSTGLVALTSNPLNRNE